MENATLPIIAGTLMAARVSDIRAMIWDRIIPTRSSPGCQTVSYTHLTLPTIRLV